MLQYRTARAKPLRLLTRAKATGAFEVANDFVTGEIEQ